MCDCAGLRDAHGRGMDLPVREAEVAHDLCRPFDHSAFCRHERRSYARGKLGVVDSVAKLVALRRPVVYLHADIHGKALGAFAVVGT